jgi:hypothetical protein
MQPLRHGCFAKEFPELHARFVPLNRQPSEDQPTGMSAIRRSAAEPQPILMRLFNRRDAMHAEKTKAPNLCVHRVSAVERALRKFAQDETISRDTDRRECLRYDAEVHGEVATKAATKVATKV